jgi:hypothetical protein
MAHITKDAWGQHAPSSREVAIPRVTAPIKCALVLAWLLAGLSVNAFASALWALIAP